MSLWWQYSSSSLPLRLWWLYSSSSMWVWFPENEICLIRSSFLTASVIARVDMRARLHLIEVFWFTLELVNRNISFKYFQVVLFSILNRPVELVSLKLLILLVTHVKALRCLKLPKWTEFYGFKNLVVICAHLNEYLVLVRRCTNLTWKHFCVLLSKFHGNSLEFSRSFSVKTIQLKFTSLYKRKVIKRADTDTFTTNLFFQNWYHRKPYGFPNSMKCHAYFTLSCLKQVTKTDE